MASVKGSKIISKLDFVRDNYGPGMVEHVIDALPLADQNEVRTVILSGWYPIEVYHRLLDAVYRIAGNGDGEIFNRIGEYSADHLFKSAYRSLMAPDPKEVLDNMIPLHSMLNEPGKMTVEFAGTGECTVEVWEPPAATSVCRCGSAFYRRVVELCGCEQVSVREPECAARGAERCRFVIEWA